jgi:hypothetical protein
VEPPLLVGLVAAAANFVALISRLRLAAQSPYLSARAVLRAWLARTARSNPPWWWPTVVAAGLELQAALAERAELVPIRLSVEPEVHPLPLRLTLVGVVVEARVRTATAITAPLEPLQPPLVLAGKAMQRQVVTAALRQARPIPLVIPVSPIALVVAVGLDQAVRQPRNLVVLAAGLGVVVEAAAVALQAIRVVLVRTASLFCFRRRLAASLVSLEIHYS